MTTRQAAAAPAPGMQSRHQCEPSALDSRCSRRSERTPAHSPSTLRQKPAIASVIQLAHSQRHADGWCGLPDCPIRSSSDQAMRQRSSVQRMNWRRPTDPHLANKLALGSASPEGLACRALTVGSATWSNTVDMSADAFGFIAVVGAALHPIRVGTGQPSPGMSRTTIGNRKSRTTSRHSPRGTTTAAERES